MRQRPWDAFLTDQDKAHLAAAGPKGRYGFGSNAAVLSVDNYRKAVGDRPEPLLEAIRTWPGSTGAAAWQALAHIERVLATARQVGIPVIHVTGLPKEESGMPGWGATLGGRHDSKPKTPEELDRHARRYDIVEQAAPVPGEVVLKKTAPSSFFGTPLASHLIGEGIDTLIVVGESASGCVRATVVDGRSYRFRMIVAEEAVYDRHEATRAMNLFDMDQKYADVLPVGEVLTWMEGRAGSVATTA